MIAIRARREVIVGCPGGHRVRLGSGILFFRRARCPKCGVVVDPSRFRRGWAVLALPLRPASKSGVDIGVWAMTVAAVTLSVVGCALVWSAGDRWWPATALLFGPRWLLLLPVVVAVVLTAARDRVLLLPLALAAWLVVGPVMGLRLGWRSWFSAPGGGTEVTVASLNVAGVVTPFHDVDGLMRNLGADVAAIQECGTYEIYLAFEKLHGWHGWWEEQMCLVSRFEILEVRVMDREAFDAAGGSALVFASLLRGDQGPFWVTNVHLETPRRGLELLQQGSMREASRELGRLTRLRELEHRAARRFVDEIGRPHIVAGDFNTPIESSLYRAEWRGWQNAFSRAGVGFGGTRLSGWIRARIDHILYDEGWEVTAAHVGADVGSDHLPMVATLRRRDLAVR
jgi:endonuclease/exonuclease/phosphatase (EEP) superfamily protein YafD